MNPYVIGQNAAQAWFDSPDRAPSEPVEQDFVSLEQHLGRTPTRHEKQAFRRGFTDRMREENR